MKKADIKITRALLEKKTIRLGTLQSQNLLSKTPEDLIEISDLKEQIKILKRKLRR